jgi:hypothetical protein
VKVIASVVASSGHPHHPPSIAVMQADGPNKDTPFLDRHIELWVHLDEGDPTRLIGPDGEREYLVPVALSDEDATALYTALGKALGITRSLDSRPSSSRL